MTTVAGIREELTLIDRFSSVFDKFINMGGQAANKAAAVEAQSNRMASAAASSAQAFARATDSVNFYQKTLNDVERRMDAVNSKLYFAELMPGGRKQQSKMNSWRKESDVLEAEQGRLRAALARATSEADRLAPAVRNAVDPTKVMHDEFRGMQMTILKITALLGGLAAEKKFLELGVKTDSYEKMLQARLGSEELGSAAFQHYRGMANKYGFAQDEVMQSVAAFMSMTTVPKQIDDLLLLAKRMAVFDTTGQGLKGAQFSLQEAMSGDFQSLRRRFNIGTAMLEASGVKTAAKSGDMEKFVAAMEKLFQMRNMGEDAFNRMMQSPKWQINQLEARWNNAMSGMAQTTILRLLPAIQQFSATLASPAGEKFFSFLAYMIGAAAWAALQLGNAFFGFIRLIEPFQPVLEVVFYTLLIAGAVKAAVALWAMIPPLAIQFSMWMMMNAPLLAVIGIIVVLLSLFLKFPEVFGVVTGAVTALGAVFLNIFRAIGNTWIDLYNMIVDGLNRLSGAKIGRVGRFEFTNIGDAYAAGKNWGIEAATKLGDSLAGLKVAAGKGITAPWDSFEGKQLDIGDVGKIKSQVPVKLSNEDLKMLLDISDRDYINKVNMTQLTPTIQVQVDARGGEVDANGVAERIKYMLIEQAASSTNLAYGG